MDKETKKIIIWGGVAVGAFIIINNGLDSVFQFLGIKQTPQQAAVQTALTTKSGNGLDPTYWQQITTDGSSLISDSVVSSLVSAIANSHDWLLGGYQFDQVMGAFKQLNNKAQTSYLAYKFQQSEGSDLLTWMNSQSNWTWPLGNRYSPDQINTLIQYVNNLPNS